MVSGKDRFGTVAWMAVIVCAWIFSQGPCFAERTVISLDGNWQIEQGTRDRIPTAFSHTVPVPGLVDLARPAFTEVGVESPQRDTFWYKREFRLDGPAPRLAVLMIRKAMYGADVYLNGQNVTRTHLSFTPILVDITEHLRGPGQTNELIVGVGGPSQRFTENRARWF